MTKKKPKMLPSARALKESGLLDVREPEFVNREPTPALEEPTVGGSTVPSDTVAAMLCEHANEVPMVCRCQRDCHCRQPGEICEAFNRYRPPLPDTRRAMENRLAALPFVPVDRRAESDGDFAWRRRDALLNFFAR